MSNLPFLLLALAGCHKDPQDTGAAPRDVESLAFSDFSPWDTPIADYQEAARDSLGHDDFLQGVHDLAVFDDRLFLGYGDANLNLGRIFPIEVRAWADPEPGTAAAELTTDEEQIDLFRVAGDTLLLPGVDATEDGFLGNAYTRPMGGAWSRSRTLEQAWHVHDMARVGDTLYACGSGGWEEDYTNSTVNAFLYRSDDGGQTFVIDQQVPQPAPPGDNRFTHLLVVEDQLHVFGYWSDASSIVGFHSLRLAGDTLEELDLGADTFVSETESLAPGVGLVAGLLVGYASITWQAWRVTPEGAERSDVFTSWTVLDTAPLGDGRALVLLLEGNAYPSPTEGPFPVSVGITSEVEDLRILHTQSLELLPSSIAFWRDSLYLGLPDGQVWRAAGQ